MIKNGVASDSDDRESPDLNPSFLLNILGPRLSKPLSEYKESELKMILESLSDESYRRFLLNLAGVSQYYSRTTVLGPIIRRIFAPLDYWGRRRYEDDRMLLLATALIVWAKETKSLAQEL